MSTVSMVWLDPSSPVPKYQKPYLKEYVRQITETYSKKALKRAGFNDPRAIDNTF